MYAKEKRSASSVNVRMDSLKDTVSEYGNQLTLYGKQLERARKEKAYLQDKLLRERKQTTDLKAQVEALKNMKKNLEERERCQAMTAKDLELQVEKADEVLNQKLQRAVQLQGEIDQEIYEIEKTSQDILSKFQKLKLKDLDYHSGDGTERSVSIDEEIVHLEADVSRLQKENDHHLVKEEKLPWQELKLATKACDQSLAAKLEEKSAMKKEAANLEENLKRLRRDKEALQ